MTRASHLLPRNEKVWGSIPQSGSAAEAPSISAFALVGGASTDHQTTEIGAVHRLSARGRVPKSLPKRAQKSLTAAFLATVWRLVNTRRPW